MADSLPLRVKRTEFSLVGEQWPGTGPVAVFLHAGVTDRRSWSEVAPRLTGSSTPVAYDRRGFGQTPVSSTSFSHLDDLVALLEAVTDQPAWLVGSSMGGGLALDAALLAPRRVAGLVLIAPSVGGAPDGELDADTARFDRLIDAAGTSLDEINRLETWLWLDGPGQPEGRVRAPVRSLATAMNEIILRNDVPEGAGASALDVWSRTDDIRQPVTVACGDLDVPLLMTRSRELADRLPSGKFVELTGVAHLPQMENPAMVADLIRGALS